MSNPPTVLDVMYSCTRACFACPPISLWNSRAVCQRFNRLEIRRYAFAPPSPSLELPRNLRLFERCTAKPLMLECERVHTVGLLSLLPLLSRWNSRGVCQCAEQFATFSGKQAGGTNAEREAGMEAPSFVRSDRSESRQLRVDTEALCLGSPTW